MSANPAPETKPPQEDKSTLVTKEFEDFAYIVSHDLNAPLRHVKEFTRLLVGTKKERLSNEEKEYVDFLEKSLVKLDRMQESLLTYSRLNTRAGPFKEVDTNQTVTEVIEELARAAPQYRPVIECGKLPVVLAEPRQIWLLFVNLIDNALKFHDPASTQRKVVITATDRGNAWLFEIRDNGIGIDKKYHEEVFRLFRRLNADNYPGTGAGLTIARKIIRRHGGDIFIESRPGQGASVFFMLPKL